MSGDVVEAEVVEETEAEAIEDAPEQTTALVHAAPQPPTREVLSPLDADQVVAAMEAYQALLPRLLDSSDYQQTGESDGKGGKKKFVKKSGWRKIAKAFNLSIQIIEQTIERDAEGNPLRARVVARAIAPNGQVQDGDGYCSITEFTGRRADSTKIENDLRGTATTRAKNRATADLVGMGEVSAEEAAVGGAPSGPAVERATEDEQAAAKKALGLIVGDSQKAFEVYTETLKHFNGICPKGVAVLLNGIAGAQS